MSEHGEEHHGLEKVRRKEYTILIAAGFEAGESGFWEKDGVLFGRGAALQNAWGKLHEDEKAIFPW